MADDSGIDPRYAAQFQRGFDPARHEATTDASAGPRRLAGGPAARAERVPDPPPLTRRGSRADVAAGGVLEDGDADQVEVTPHPRPAPRAEWLLLVVGLLLTVAAPVAIAVGVATPGRYSGLSADLSAQVPRLLLDFAPGPLLAAGLLGIAAWIAVRALRRSR